VKDTDNLVSKWISVLYRYRRSFMSKRLEPYGIIGGMFMTLLTINKYDGINQEQISDYLKIDKTTTAKSIKKLESEGYIKRETDFEDKRINRVYLTQKAKDIIPEIRTALAEWDQIIRSGISEEAYQDAEKTLHKMAENICHGTSSS